MGFETDRQHCERLSTDAVAFKSEVWNAINRANKIDEDCATFKNYLLKVKCTWETTKHAGTRTERTVKSSSKQHTVNGHSHEIYSIYLILSVTVLIVFRQTFWKHSDFGDPEYIRSGFKTAGSNVDLKTQMWNPSCPSLFSCLWLLSHVVLFLW